MNRRHRPLKNDSIDFELKAYFLGFYILLTVLKIDPLKAFFGALAFGFSTYLIIILGVGHNAKAHAIAYMPMVIAGVLLVFQKRFIGTEPYGN